MYEYIALIGSLLIALAVVVVLIVMNRRKNHPEKAKTQGRTNGTAKAIAKTKAFARSNGYKAFVPATLQHNGKQANLDALVVGSFGVLGVKAYGYNGNVYGAAADDEWLRVAPNGERTYFKNPVLQAAADVRAVRDVLMAQKLRNVPVEVVCVFTDKTAQLAIPRNVTYYTFKTFKQLLGKEKYLAKHGFDEQKVYAALESALGQQAKA